MKIQIVSDIHIGDYPNYETFRYERLNWYVTFAEQVVKFAKENDIHYLFIAGDTLDQPVNSPEILGVAKKVLKIFNDYYDKIYFILGQHDIKGKNYDLENIEKYSITNVISTDKMEYCHKKVINLGGRSIAMMNFHPEPDLSWINDRVDLFVGHVTINTNGFGSKIDHSKFLLGIAGDIHYPCNEDNLYSVGIGVPRYLGDASDGTCVVVDLEDLSFDRVLIDPNHEYFTRYIKTNSWDNEGPSDEKLSNGISPEYYRIYRTSEESIINQATLKEFTDERVHNINEIIGKSITENNLADIHERVLSMNPISESVDLNFKLLSLSIVNIRSIDEYTIDFTNKEGVLQIAGNNGSGKSSIIWSLNYAFRGGLDIRDEIRECCDFASVYLKLVYQGKEYGIYRGTDGVSLDIDGEYQSLGGKRETENKIYEFLPFINYLDSFFFMDYSVSIMESFSSERRIELLSTYYRIDVIQKYYETAQELIQEVYKKSGEAWKLYESENEKYQNKLSELEKLKSKVGNSLKDLLEEELSKLTDSYKKVIVLENKASEIDVESIQKRLSTTNQQLIKLKSNKSSNDFDLASGRRALKESSSGLFHSQDEINELDKKLEDKKSEYQSIKQSIKHLESQRDNYTSITCPECGSKLNIADLEVISLDDIIFKLTELNASKDLLKSEYDKLASEYNRIIEESDTYDSYEKLKNRIESLVTRSTELEELISEKQSVVEDCNDKLDSVKKLSSLESSDEISDKISEVRSKLEVFKLITDLEEEILNYKNSVDLESLRKSCDEIDIECHRYELYSELFSNNGKLYKLVLKSVLDRFCSDQFKYEVVDGYYRGKEFTDIVGYYKSYQMKNFRPYQRLSRGQRTLVDLDFIRNLVTNSGLIVFDEILKYLTNSNQIEGLRIINQMNPKLKIVTNQNENSVYVDHCISLTYNGEVTEFNEK